MNRTVFTVSISCTLVQSIQEETWVPPFLEVALDECYLPSFAFSDSTNSSIVEGHAPIIRVG